MRLDLHGPRANVKLSISDIARKLLVNIPDQLVDLLEIATYVYAADGARVGVRQTARWERAGGARYDSRFPFESRRCGDQSRCQRHLSRR